MVSESSVEGRPLEEELIREAKDGDSRAFEELVMRHQALALRAAYVVVRDHTEAEDVTQEAFVKAHGALGRFREESPFRPWLLRIVRNEALNRVRSRNRRQDLALRAAAEPASGDAAPSPEALVVARQDHHVLRELVDALPEKYRAVIVHRYLLDLSEYETAQVLGIPAGTVKSRTARAMGRLRSQLEDPS